MSYKNKVPDRWEKYTDMGRIIPGTRFIAFKVPLRQEIMQRVKNAGWFCPRTLMDHCQNLGLVIDLTDTFRYYNPEEFEFRGVTHLKIRVMGRKIPEEKAVLKFYQAVDNFLDKNKENEKVIGVHCTHGLNRTGYLVCRYMIQVLGIAPDQAIADFNSARGHEVERENYLTDLRQAPWMNQPIATYSKSSSSSSYRRNADLDNSAASLDSSANNTSTLDTTSSEVESPSGPSFRPGLSWNIPLLKYPGASEDARESLGPVRRWSNSPRQDERVHRRSTRRSSRNHPDGESPTTASTRHQIRYSSYGARRYYDQTYQGRVAPQYDPHFYQEQGSGVGPHRPLPRYQRQQQAPNNAPRQYRGPRPYRSPPNAVETATTPARREAPDDYFKTPDTSRAKDTFKTPDTYRTPDASRTPRCRPSGPTRNPLSPGAQDDVFSPIRLRRSARMTPY